MMNLKTTLSSVAILAFGGVSLFTLYPEKKIVPLDQLEMMNGQIVEASFTDNNEGERFIIQTDKEHYEGLSGVDVWFSVTNTGDEQFGDLTFLGDGFEVKSLKKYSQEEEETVKTEMVEVDCVQTGTGACFDFVQNPVIMKVDEWSDSASIVLFPQGTTFFHAFLSYLPGQKAKFSIRVDGEDGSFGLLDPDFDSGWGRRCPITLDASFDNHTDFPFVLDENSICAEMLSGPNAAQDGGADIRMTTDEAGTAEIPVEVVSFDTGGGTAEIWGKIPWISSSTGALVWIWYANPDATAPAASDTYGSQNVWDSSFKQILHFEDMSDSTSNGTTATDSGTSAISSILGNGRQFAGNDRITSNHNFTTLTPGSSLFAIEVWFRLSGTADQFLFSNPPADTISIRVNAGGADGRLVPRIYAGTEPNITDKNYADGNWQYAAIGFDGTDGFIQTGTGTRTIFNDGATVPTNDMYLGSRDVSASTFLTGDEDEFRVTIGTSRSQAWFQTSAENQSSPLNFVTVGIPDGPGLDTFSSKVNWL